MENPFNLTSCDFNQYDPWQTVLVIWAPIYSIPVYLTAILLVRNHSEAQQINIRRAQLTAAFLNYTELITLSLLYPQFRIPVLGMQVGGVLRDAYPRVVTFVVLGLAIHHDVNMTTLFIVHLRLMLLSNSLNVGKAWLTWIVTKCHQLFYLSNFLLVLGVASIILQLQLDNIDSQNFWKRQLFQKFHFEFIYCPDYFVLDISAWQFTVMVLMTCTATTTFGVLFVVCSLTTIAILHFAKSTMSVKSVRYHMQVVVLFFISCAIQAFFVILPIFHLLGCVYIEFVKVYTGGLLYYSLLIQLHQGTAVTLFFIMSHRKTKDVLKEMFRWRRANESMVFQRSIVPSQN